MKRLAIFLLLTALLYGCSMQKPLADPPVDPKPSSNTQQQASCVSGSDQVQLTSAWTGKVGDGVVLFGCGAPHSMPPPAAPTVTPSVARVMTGTGDVVSAPPGTIQYGYQIVACDKGGGCTAASPVGSTSIGNPLGSQSFSILAASRANGITTVDSMPQRLAPGAMVLLSSGISDGSFRGWYQAAAVTDSTHFTLRTGDTTSATATGGTAFWFNCNHIAYSPVAGAYRYWLLKNGAVIGVSKPVNGGFTEGTLYIDDFGSPMMDGLTVPPYLTPLFSKTSDSLVTTITAISGTTLTLADAAGTTLSSATILPDGAPLLLKAVAANAGMPTYVPAGTVINSLLDLSHVETSLVGGMRLNDTLMLPAGAKWTGDPLIEAGQGQFGFESLPEMICNATPCIHILNGDAAKISNFEIHHASNQGIDLLQDGGGGTPGTTYDTVYFGGALNFSGDYMSVPLVMRGIPGQDPAVGYLRRVNLFTGPDQVDGVSATPLWYCNDCGQVTVESVFLNRRGILFRATPSGGHFTISESGYEQGGIMPFLTVTNPGNFTHGGNTGMFIEMNNVILDTMPHPLITYLRSNGSASVFAYLVDAGNPSGAPLISGEAFAEITRWP
jgi:hypothetical protein